MGDYHVPWIPITIDNNENVVRSKYCVRRTDWGYISLSLYSIPVDLEIFIEM